LTGPVGVKPYFRADGTQVLAHRGLAVEIDGTPAAPENSLLAFARALAVGVDHIETDVHVTSDGVAVLSHDPDLRRTLGIDSAISELTLTQVKALRLSHDQEIPTLAEALDTYPDVFFNIDLKVEAAVQPVVDAVREARAVDRVLITSFTDTRRRRAVAMLPGVATSASSRGIIAFILASFLPLPALHRRVLRGVDALQMPESFRGVPVLRPKLIRRAARWGVAVQIWTVNDPADMQRLIDLGVSGVITDRADIAMTVVNRIETPGNMT
jgi:glycerophosphoryl diester phosphodiesterase